jgi:hypothetical protein
VSGPLRLWARPPADADVRPGRDLVLAAPPATAGALPPGTLIDDHLAPAARVAVECEARSRAAAWVEARSAELQVDGIDLAWVWAVEIYRQAALTAVRLVHGVRAAAAGAPAECAELHAVEADALDEAGVPVRAANGPGALELPSDVVRMSTMQRLAIRARVPVPQVVRGSVRLLDHWTLDPLVRALAADGRLTPVLDPGLLHGLPRRELLALGVRGGWIGSPGPFRRARSEQLVRDRLARLEAPAGDALDRLVDWRARKLLADRAHITPALVDRQRRAFARGRIRLLVVPFDSIAPVRTVLVAAREHGVPSLLVQHGFAPEPDDPDMRESDHVAVWHERQAARVERGGRPATVTGNPGAPAGRASRRPTASPGRTVLLVQPPSPFSVRWDARISRRSVETGLAGLAAARPGSTVVLRPHPQDPDPEAHATAAPGLQVMVDRATPIHELLASCDLCIGGVSTATLQAGALGVPVVFLDLTGMPTAWPFDGTSEVPMARDAGELVDQVRRAVAAPDVLGGDALAEALGVADGVVGRLVELAVGLARVSAASRTART